MDGFGSVNSSRSDQIDLEVWEMGVECWPSINSLPFEGRKEKGEITSKVLTKVLITHMWEGVVGVRTGVRPSLILYLFPRL